METVYNLKPRHLVSCSYSNHCATFHIVTDIKHRSLLKKAEMHTPKSPYPAADDVTDKQAEPLPFEQDKEFIDYIDNLTDDDYNAQILGTTYANRHRTKQKGDSGKSTPLKPKRQLTENQTRQGNPNFFLAEKNFMPKNANKKVALVAKQALASLRAVTRFVTLTVEGAETTYEDTLQYGKDFANNIAQRHRGCLAHFFDVGKGEERGRFHIHGLLTADSQEIIDDCVKRWHKGAVDCRELYEKDIVSSIYMLVRYMINDTVKIIKDGVKVKNCILKCGEVKTAEKMRGVTEEEVIETIKALAFLHYYYLPYKIYTQKYRINNKDMLYICFAFRGKSMANMSHGHQQTLLKIVEYIRGSP